MCIPGFVVPEMKPTIAFFMALLITLISTVARAQTSQPYSHSPSRATPGNGQTTAAVVQDNSQQLATQLENLQSAVEQTLPELSSFNQTLSNAAPASHSWGTTISNLVSGTLNRGSSSSTAETHMSPTLSNLLAKVRGRLGTTNTPNTASTSVGASELATLQSQLQAVDTTLRRLRGEIPQSGTTSTSSEVIPSRATNAHGEVLSPTGR
jgi:hypothetical protein